MLASIDYVTPYRIDALDCDGLSSMDISRSLGASHTDVKRKMKRMAESIEGFLEVSRKLHPASEKGGRPADVMYVPTYWAKFIVARYENERGNGYLQFLLRCEEVALRVLPELYRRIDELERENERLLEKRERKLLPKDPRALIFIYDLDLFGQRRIVKRIWVDEKDASQIAVLEGKRWLCIRSAEGLMAKARSIDEKLMTLNPNVPAA